jgi:hypothetical protein
MTFLRQHDAVPSHAVASETAEDARWLPSGHSIFVALVLGAAAGTIAAFVMTLARAEGLVSWL